MSRFRFRERWSLPGRRSRPADVGARMAAWLLDVVHVLGADLSWSPKKDEATDTDTLVRRLLSLEAAVEGSPVASAFSEHGLSRGSRPVAGGRIELTRVAPFVQLTVDTHGSEEHWDVDVMGITEEAMRSLRESRSRCLGAEAEIGGARRDAPDPLPVTIARGTSEELALWSSDLEWADVKVSCDGGALRLESVPLPDLDALHNAKITLGQVLSESGLDDDWDERAIELLLALDAGR